jgi:hypothetical protein
MAEIDPIKTLGLASQFKTPAADNKALRELQKSGAITGMQQRGATERSTASDLSRLTGALAPHGLSPESIRQPGVLSTILGQIGAKRGGESAASFVKAGIRDIGEGDYKPGEFYKRDVTAGHMLPGVAMEATKLKAEREKGEVREGVERTPGGKFEKYKRHEKYRETGEGKGPRRTQQRVEELHNIVAAKFGKNAKIVGETDTHFSISIDGAEPVLVRKRIVKRK